MSLSPTEPICAGDVWLFRHTHNTDKETLRWCVVVFGEDAAGYVTVVFGGSNPHPGAQHVVFEVPRELRKMGLRVPTYFRYGNVLKVQLSEFRQKMGECPQDRFTEIETIHYEFGKRHKRDVPKQG